MLLLTQLTDDNSLIVHDWDEIRISPNRTDDNSNLGFYHDVVQRELSAQPHGYLVKFDDLELRCKCTDEYCPTRITVRCNGEITINENGKSLTAKVDPRYTSQIYMATCPIDQYNDLIGQGQVQLGEPVKGLTDIKDIEAGKWFEYAEDIFIRMNHYYDADSLSACVDMDGDVRFFRGMGKVVERYNVRFAVI